MKNKKRYLAIALVVALIAIISVGTLAWFTDSDEVTNVFTFGEVSITLHDENKDGEPFNGEDGSTQQPLLPGVPVVKKVYAENTASSALSGNDAYVRTFIGVPEKLDAVLDLTFDTSNWTLDSSDYIAEIDGIRYKVYQFTYGKALEAGQSTEPVLTAVALDEKVDYDHEQDKLFIPTESGKEILMFEVNDLREMNIPVAMQAVQTGGFEDADAAFAAAFDGCPWAEAEPEDEAEVNYIITDNAKDQTFTWSAPEDSGFEKLDFTIPAGTFSEPVKADFKVSSDGNSCELAVSFIKLDENGEPILDEDDNPILVTPDTDKLVVDVYSPYPQVGSGTVTASVEINLPDDADWMDWISILNCINWHQTTTD